MGLFVCDECNVVENTALSRYWVRNTVLAPELEGRALCSQCDPETGRWHGKFPREEWDCTREVKNRPTREDPS